MTLRLDVETTALLGNRTGIGNMTAQCLTRLVRQPDLAVRTFALTWRGRNQLPAAIAELGGAAHMVRRPLPAHLLRFAWRHVAFPPLDLLIGSADVVWGPNFVVPPLRSGRAVATVHDLTPLRFPQLCTADTLAYPQLIVAAARRGAWFHTPTEAVADEVRNWLPAAADRVVAVPLAVTPAVGGDASAGRRTTGGRPYVLALSTIEPRKGLPVLVAAFDRVAASDRDLALVIAGPDGWGDEALAEALATARHRSRIHRLGWVDDQTRADLLTGASVFAAPSIYEGFGLPTADALAAGLPVVTSDDPALVEVSGEAALHVPVGDVGALAEAISTLIGNPAQAAELAAKGPAQVAGLTWDATACGLTALFHRAAGR